MDLISRNSTVVLGSALGVLADAVAKDAHTIEGYKLQWQGLSEEMAEFTRMSKLAVPAAMPKEWAPKNIGPTGDVGVTNFERASAALDKQRVESERAAAAADRLAEAQRKAYEASIVWGSGIEAAINYVANLTREIDALHTRGTLKLSDVLEFEKLPFDKPIEDLVRFRNSVTYFSAEGSKAWATYKQAVEQADRTQQRMSFENFSKAFQSLPQTILGAVQGGGNVARAIGTSLLGGLGQDIGKDIGANIAKNIGGTLGKHLGGLAGPIGGILGSLAGDLAGKLFGKLFGPSQAAQVLQMRNKFVEAAGGLDVLRERAERAGVSMDRLMNARTTSDFQRAMEDFNRQLAAAEKHMQAVAEHTQKFNDELGGLLREANDIGLILPDALNDSMLAMIESGQITGETAELLRALGQGGEANFKAMENAAKKYGIELSALGPAFQQNKLDKTAGEIIDAFNVLMKGGADITGVIAGMSDEINKFVQEAVKSGRTVPENMRPILDKMLEQGQLTDENGQKLKDLSTIKFGPPIETAMDRLIKKIEELIDKFEKGMPRSFSAAADAGEKFASRVGTAIEGIPDRIEFHNDTPGFDVGGVVGRHYRPPTSRDVIPALLRPGEVVLTPEQASRGLSRGGDTAVSVVINVAGYLDSATARANLADVVKTELSKQLRREGRAA
jgi:polyhydroxyalkanoate synthesis regulator phasin